MFRNNFAVKGICTIILFMTMGSSQVDFPASLSIKNIDKDAGTLEIHMTSQAGCKMLSTGGSFDASFSDQTTCVDHGTGGNSWFDGNVQAFQFYIKGITITGVSGGTAEAAFGADAVLANPAAGIVLGYGVGAVISAGSGVLTTICFSDPEDEICFVETNSACIDDFDNNPDTPETIQYNVDSCTGDGTYSKNRLSDTGVNNLNGIVKEVVTNWGNCWCGLVDGEEKYFDDCGACAGTGAMVDEGVIPETGDCCLKGQEQDCAGKCGGATLDADEDGVCDETDTCPDTPSAETADTTTGCSESQLSISQISTYMPDEFSISQNFPNPFNPVTSITFDVAEMDEVSLIVYDLTGKEVVTLVSGTYTPGTYNVEWNAVNNIGDGIVSGMYIYRYTSSEKAITRKMLYVK